MKRIHITKAALSVFLRITALALLIWLLCMAALTLITARMYTELLADDMKEAQDMFIVSENINEDSQAVLAHHMLAAVRRVCRHGYSSSKIPAESMKPLFSESLPYQSAAAVFSAENDLLLAGGRAYLNFKLAAGYDDLAKHPYEISYIDLSALNIDEELLAAFDEWWYTAMDSSWPYIFRFSGSFDGAEFIPTRIEYSIGGIYFSSWSLLYEAEGGISDGAETIYSENVDYCGLNGIEPVQYDGTTYPSIDKLLIDLAEKAAQDSRLPSYFSSSHIDRYSLKEITLFDVLIVRLDPVQPVVYYMPYIIHAEPLKTAMNQLGNVYITSLATAVLLALAAALTIKRHFLDPIHTAYIGVTDGWGYVSSKLDKPIRWKDAEALTRALRDRDK